MSDLVGKGITYLGEGDGNSNLLLYDTWLSGKNPQIIGTVVANSPIGVITAVNPDSSDPYGIEITATNGTKYYTDYFPGDTDFKFTDTNPGSNIEVDNDFVQGGHLNDTTLTFVSTNPTANQSQTNTTQAVVTTPDGTQVQVKGLKKPKQFPWLYAGIGAVVVLLVILLASHKKTPALPTPTPTPVVS